MMTKDTAMATLIADNPAGSWRTITKADADALCMALAPYMHREPFGSLWKWFDGIRMQSAGSEERDG